MALEQLLATLEREAEAKAAAALTAARAEATRIEGESAAGLEQRRASRLAARDAELRVESEREVAAARRETQKAVLAARQRFLDRVFAAARSAVRSAASDPVFLARLPGDLATARAYLRDGPVTVRHRPELMEPLARLTAGDPSIRLVSDPEAGTGIQLEDADGSVEVDHTLEGRLDRLGPRLAIEVVALQEHEP